MLKRLPQLFRSNVLATSPGESKPEKLLDRVRDLMRTDNVFIILAELNYLLFS
jgi:hypothetical protein